MSAGPMLTAEEIAQLHDTAAAQHEKAARHHDAILEHPDATDESNEADAATCNAAGATGEWADQLPGDGHSHPAALEATFAMGEAERAMEECENGDSDLAAAAHRRAAQRSTTATQARRSATRLSLLAPT